MKHVLATSAGVVVLAVLFLAHLGGQEHHVQVGVCTPLKDIEAARTAGFEYLELGTSEIAALSDADFESALARIKALGLPVPVTNPLTNAPLTVFNLDPAFQGLVHTVVQNSSINHRDYMAYEGSVQARVTGGGTLLGGWAMERTRTVSCDTTNPNVLLYCDQTGALHQDVGAVSIPYRHEFKLAASYPLPWQFQAGVSLLSYPGLPLTVNWAVPLALLPNKSAPPSVPNFAGVPIIAPGTSYLPRWNQLDVHFTREIRAGRFAVRPTLEVFNLLNSSVVLNQNQAFGSTLGRPTSTLQGRLMKLSALIKF